MSVPPAEVNFHGRKLQCKNCTEVNIWGWEYGFGLTYDRRGEGEVAMRTGEGRGV